MAARRAMMLMLLLVAFLVGCRPATPPPSAADLTQVALTLAPKSTLSPATPTLIPAEVTEIRNAQYQLGAVDTEQLVQLHDGKFEQGLPGSDNFISILITDLV